VSPEGKNGFYFDALDALSMNSWRWLLPTPLKGGLKRRLQRKSQQFKISEWLANKRL